VRLGVSTSNRGGTAESLRLEAETALAQRELERAIPRPSATGRPAAQTGASS
jgi:hypothetical protein